MQRRRLEFSVASASSQGARQYQEDSSRVWYPDGEETANGRRPVVLAIVSDGMGGHVSGEVASKLVCDQSLQHFLATPGEPEDKIKTVLNTSNGSLEQAIRLNAKLSGMGCTLVAAYLDSDGARWASVGDSSLLLFRGDQLYRLNDDHSLGALLDKQAAANLITYDEAHNSPNRHGLRSALTGAEIDLIDRSRSPLALEPGDVVIIASDGIQTLSHAEILSQVEAHAARGPGAIADALLAAVDAAGDLYQDNTTVVVVRVTGD
jgi:protein phosphatase